MKRNEDGEESWLIVMEGVLSGGERMMWLKLYDKVINLDKVEMVELIEDKDGRRILFHFVDDSVYPVWETSSREGKKEFECVWRMFKTLPMLAMSCCDFLSKLSEELSEDRDSGVVKK